MKNLILTSILLVAFTGKAFATDDVCQNSAENYAKEKTGAASTLDKRTVNKGNNVYEVFTVRYGVHFEYEITMVSVNRFACNVAGYKLIHADPH